MDALASGCKLASDRELAALLSVDEPVVMAASWLANDVPSPTGPAEVAAAARLDNDDTLPTANDDQFVGRFSSDNAADFSVVTNTHTVLSLHSLVATSINFCLLLVMQHSEVWHLL